MSRHGNILAEASFTFPEDKPAHMTFSITYDGDGSETIIEFEQNMMKAAIEVLNAFRLNKEKHYGAMFDAILEKARHDMKWPPGQNQSN